MELLTPVGRIVRGHPMVVKPVKDDNGVAKMQKDGVTPSVSSYFGLAIMKTPGVDWKGEEWGQVIVNQARAGFPAGESESPQFAWKIVDGDSTVPNKVGKKPCDQEGYPGHWVINLSTGLPIKCFHTGKLNPYQQITDKNEIKAGDYVRCYMSVKDNKESQSKNVSKSYGMFLNPSVVEVVQAGQEILLSNDVDASVVFSQPVVMPSNVVPMQGATPPLPQQPGGTMPPPPVPTITPAPDILQPAPRQYNVGGSMYTREQLASANWSDAQIDALP